MHSENKKANRLIDERSPYLLQHAYNPVDWYPWGDEAFAQARREDKPVFLSIGYSTCHWCHVMERESFEDEEVAALLNSDYIAVKVDREERPDLDQVYMAACQALTGQGGWPLTVFLTPDRKPFFAGTYFPKGRRHGLPGMTDLLPRLARLWREEREKASRAAGELYTLLQQADRPPASADLPGRELLDEAYRRLHDSFDHRYGGFGGAPKFPSPHQLTFLLRYWRDTGEKAALEMAAATLKAMARGGIFDQLGFGFHRYSVDDRWLVPHFEKMLYDQAGCALAYLEAYQATGEELFAVTAGQIFAYLLRDLRSPEGAFYAAEDADSEGEEGTFYVWSPREMEAVLGPERGPLAAAFYGVGEAGNFEKGKSVLHRPRETDAFAASRELDPAALEKQLEQSREELLQARSRRERPFRDDKIITAWNGLAIAALARGAAVLGDPLYARAAAEAAEFINRKLTAGGRLMRRFREGEAAVPAFLEDYAALAWGLLELYQATFEERFLAQSCRLAGEILRLFDGGAGLLRLAGTDTEETEDISPLAEAYDGASPSAVSLSAFTLLRLGRLLRREEWTEGGEAVLRAYRSRAEQFPTGHTFYLAALDFALSPPEELVVAGEAGSPSTLALLDAARSSYRPRLSLLFHPAGDSGGPLFELAPFLADMAPSNGTAAAYYCRERHCLPPVASPRDLTGLLSE